MQRTYSIHAAAEMLERDRRTLVRALRAVKPDAHEKRAPRWKLSTIFDALLQHEMRGAAPGRIVDEHARLTRARAEKVERENAIAAGRYVDLELVGSMLEEENKVVAEHFLNLSSHGYALALAARTAPSDDVAGVLVGEQLRQAVHAALTEAAAPADLLEMAQDSEARRHGRRLEPETETKDAAV